MTKNNGKCGAYVNGAQSSQRLRSILQIGNVVSFNWIAKTDGQLGRFETVEMDQNNLTFILNDRKAISAIQSACTLLDMFLAEREEHTSLFHGTLALLQAMKREEWPAVYIMWEIAFLKEMGYGIDLSQCAVCKTTKNLTHISPRTGRAVCHKDAEPYLNKLLEIPSFIQGASMKDGDIVKGLHLTEYFFIHRLLQYSSYQRLPESRESLQNSMDSV